MIKRAAIFIALLSTFSCQDKEKAVKFSKMDAVNTGIDFANALEETHSYNYFTYPYMYLGGGVAIGDFNNDGLEDIFFTGNMVSNRLYLNKGDFRFEDVSESSGVVGDERWYSGATTVDINGDGWLDIYCSVGGKYGPNNNVLYINNGDNTFSERGRDFGVDCDGISMHAVFFDYDRDADLDLFVINYPPTSFTAPVEYYHYMLENHEIKDSDRLYRNDGDRFTDVTDDAGIRTFGLSLGVVATDFNNDGFQDIFISNDFNAPDFLFINNQDGTFSNEIDSTLQQTSFFGMGVDAADFNNDGLVDIFQLDMSSEDNYRAKANMSSMNPTAFYQSVELGLHHQYMQNSLQLNHGNRSGELPLFSNMARIAGVSSTDWSWGALMADFDNDGWKDIFVTNGIRRDVNNKDFYNKYRSFFKKMESDPEYKGKEEEVELLKYLDELPSEKLTNYMFHNKGDLTFENEALGWGLGEKTFSNGVAYSDLDNDGDLDLIVNNLEDVAGIYRNNSQAGSYLKVQLEGGTNTLSEGARVWVHTDGSMQMQEHNVVRGYLSSVSPILHFGLGSASKIDSLIVTWPDGTRGLRKDVLTNQVVTLSPDENMDEGAAEAAMRNTIFTNAELQDPFLHTENPFNDFEKEVLLPHKNSTLGPCLGVGDLNGDGLDDFIVGGATGQAPGLFYQNTSGQFDGVIMEDLVDDRYHEDLGVLIFDADGDGDQDLYMASGGNEYPAGSGAYQDRFYENIGEGKLRRIENALPKILESGQDVSASDYDGDGDLDLFVGGRIVPKRYPNPANSYILENVSDASGVRFIDATKRVAPGLSSLGLVTGSIWSDFDQDGYDDLIVVGEWMSIKFFKNDYGVFKDVSDDWAPENSRGWWFSIEQGDFDGDGDIDLVAGNLGKNYKYQASAEKPFRIYLNDFDRNQTEDIVLSYTNGEEEYPVRGRQCSSEQMPAIKIKFQDYNSFASASLKQIYTTDMLESSLSYEVTSFSSVFLENVGDRFVASPLPQPAQISSVNAFVVDDFDGDGNLDLVLAGNFYNAEVETPRNDASFGLYLKGDGGPKFLPLSMMESGLKIVGDVTAMQSISVQGVPHIVVAKNNDYTQLLKVNAKVSDIL